MLSSIEVRSIKKSINDSLDRAELHWKRGGYEIALEEATIFDSSNYEHSRLPNHPVVGDDRTVIDEFIALVVDMRESSKHLSDTNLSFRINGLDSGLQRVYYETSALLSALAQVIEIKNGSVTEFLGDGVLAFFPKETGYKSIVDAYNVAEVIVTKVRTIVNDILHERYSLPGLNIGVGLSCSKAIVNLVGIEGNKHPKAFGDCVFKATKLSSGHNQVFVDEKLIKLLPLCYQSDFYIHSVRRIFECNGIRYGRLNIEPCLIS